MVGDLATVRVDLGKTLTSVSTPLGKAISEARSLIKSLELCSFCVDVTSLVNVVHKEGYWLDILDKAYRSAKSALDKFCSELYRLVWIR